MTIFNRYKNIFDNLINNSDLKSPDWPDWMDEKSRNALKSVGNLTELLKKN